MQRQLKYAYRYAFDFNCFKDDINYKIYFSNFKLY